MVQQLARVRAVSSGWPGGPGLNTFYFAASNDQQPDSTISQTEVQLAHDRVHAVFDTGAALFPTTWTCTVSPEVDVIQDTDGELVNQFTADPSAPVPGLSGNGFGPSPVMILLRLHTQAISDGKRIAGRAFFGPLNAGQDTNGSPNPDAIDVAESMGAALLDAGPGGVPTVQVWRRPRLARDEPPLAARPGFHGEVTATTVPDRFSILRSRRD